MDEDRELLEQYARAGCESAFSELVARHLRWVHSAATRQVGDADLAKDVTQTVFSDLARKARGFPRNTLVGPWLHRATRLASAQVRRANQRRIHREQIHWEMNPPEPHTPPSWTELRGELDSALDQLPERDRSAIVLRFFEHRDLRGVGAALGVGEDAAQKRVTRALEQLRDLLARQGVVSSVPALAGLLTAHAVVSAPPALAATVAGIALAQAPALLPAAGLLSLMSTSPLKIAATAVLILGVTLPWTITRRSQRHLQTEVDQLRALNQQLAADLDTARQRLASPAPAPQAPEVQAELLRLRGEVALLRRQAADRSGPLARKTPAPPTETSEPLADVGNASPEAAATTALWAIAEGNRQRLGELVVPDPEVDPETRALRQDSLFHTMTNAFSRRSVTAIQEVRTNSGGSCTVFFGFEDLDTGKPDVLLVELRPTDSGWRLDPGKFQYVTEAVPATVDVLPKP